VNIDKIALSGFTSHDRTIISLPPAGLVTVAGPNGSGKSSLVEAVSAALWGKSLRGSAPWRDGAKGQAAVQAGALMSSGIGELEAQRDRSDGGKTSLFWTVPGQQSTIYDTATKAQEALEQIVGPWEVWRRTHVFSSSDAAHFSTATDAERKRLMERLLGIDRFDAALVRCRAELAQAETKAGIAERDLAVAAAKLEAAEKAVAAAAAEVQAAPPPALDKELLQEKAAKQEKLAADAQKEARAARGREQQALSGMAGKGADLRGLTQRLGALSGKAECPTCRQHVPADLVEQLTALVAAEATRARAAEQQARQEAAQARQEAEELDEEADALRRRAQALRQEVAAVTARAEAHARADAALQRASTARLAVLEDRAGAQARVAAEQARADLLRAVDKVLGMKGARAHVLARALAGLESAGASWLSRLSRGAMEMKLSAYSEKKAGGQSDVLSIKLGPVGGQLREYDSLSGGERRRVDVALLLALSEIAAAAAGKAPGTLFLDEVADALDPDGLAAVSEALEELARTRCVVVITHSPELAERLPAKLRLTVDKGRVSVA
jgi:DNA repair exonuclease SbcCD ATPase subunit